MKTLKIIGLILLSILVIWVIVAAVSPQSMGTAQSINIERSPSLVFMQVSKLENWNHWSPWFAMDPDMKQSYSEVKIGLGASVSWKSETMGNGVQTIVESTFPKTLRTQLEFEDWDDTSYSSWEFVEVNDGTAVTWIMEKADLPFLLRPLGIIWNKKLEENYIQGLKNLKAHCETLDPNQEKLAIRKVDTESFYYIGKEVHATVKNVGPKMGQTYGDLYAYISSENLTISGQPFALNLPSQSDTMKMIVGLPIASDHVVKSSKFTYGLVPGGEAIRVSHFGAYENLPSTYQILMNWMRKNNYATSKNSYEVYITDPAIEPDTAKWETRIYYPI